ncbi:MAG TPA: NAD(P)-dependent oxidoreductase [Chthonomonadaceae bacterium]|nr:NAD(P)-dependent oxidoreductase [Chthonomonadaceae bacterium]
MASEKEVLLITGSSGLIGSAAAQRFAASYRVIGLDQEHPKDASPLAEYIYIDMTSDDSVQHALFDVRDRHGDRIASVIHLAAYYDFSGEPSPKYEQVTVRGTERLLCGLQNFQVEQFVFSSSMLVYAPCQPGQRIDEDWPLEPKWDYPKSKVKTEERIRAEHGNIPYVLLRIAGVYDDQCRSIPIAHQIQRLYEHRLTATVFPGDLSHGQAFLHVDDLVEALWQVVARRASLPTELVLLIGEPETLSYDDLQREIYRLLYGKGWVTREIPKPLAKAGVWLENAIPGEEPFIKPSMVDIADDHYALDITRARNLLGWEPRHSLRETLPKMIAFLKSDPAGFYKANKLGSPPQRQEAPGAGDSSPPPTRTG